MKLAYKLPVGANGFYNATMRVVEAFFIPHWKGDALR